MSRRARSKARMFAIALALAAVPATVTVVSPAIGGADSCSDAATNAPLPIEVGACADVLAQEARWLVLQNGVWMALSAQETLP